VVFRRRTIFTHGSTTEWPKVILFATPAVVANARKMPEPILVMLPQ
jgi:hypothetical protein